MCLEVNHVYSVENLNTSGMIRYFHTRTGKIAKISSSFLLFRSCCSFDLIGGNNFAAAASTKKINPGQFVLSNVCVWIFTDVSNAVSKAEEQVLGYRRLQTNN